MKNDQSTLKKNYIYNFIYQLLTIIMPLLTVPYVSRILSVDGIGIHSYTYSIVNYFMLFAMLGTNNYGNRTIAKVRNNKTKLSENFWSIYLLQIIMSVTMIILYLIYVLLFVKENVLVSLIQMIYLLSTIFDINWFFFGLEKFKITITRNMILKLFTTILIFIFIKSNNDVWLYTLILSVSTLIGQLLLFPFLIKEVSFVKVNIKDIKKHIKPCLVLFVPIVAISLYNIMDKIMLGNMSSISEVGIYEQADKIVNIPMGLVTALGTVMLPRISSLISVGEDEKVYKYIKKSVNFMVFLAFPICFGLISVSSDLVPLFLGSSFDKSKILIYYLSFKILFISFANVIRTQYLIPKEKDKIYIKSVCLGALVNLIINYILIPKYQSVGACIGTICAEFFVMFYQTMSVRKELPILEYLKDINGFFIKGLVMFIFVLLLKLLELSPIITIILQLIIGGVVYSLLNWDYINSIIHIKSILNRFRKKLIK